MQPISNANDLVRRLESLGTVVIYLIVLLGVIYIIWQIVRYFIKGKAGDENRKEASMNALWGIIGLAIILSLWGLVNILVNTFYTGELTSPPRPAPNVDFINRGL